MPFNVQAIPVEKVRWNDGLLAIVSTKNASFGGSEILEDASELTSARAQFAAAPGIEIVAFAGGGKKVKAAVFLSTSHVKNYSPSDKLRIIGARIVRLAQKLKLDRIIVPAEKAYTADISLLVQGMESASYRFDKYKSAVSDRSDPTIQVVVNKAHLKNVQAMLAVETKLFAGIVLARDLVNEIPAELYPERLADQARKATSDAGLKVTVYDEKRLAKENFNGVLTVGRGSNHPPRLVVMSHTPQKKSNVHLCLVGKAVTFDTGGHSIKPAKGMWEMEGDMAGGAAVIGAMQVIGQLKPAVRVTGIVPSSLNAIGPEAMLPGDIIRSRSGKTVHVDNTDAEGRLILMDALNLAQELGATHIVDVATLTGSIVRALGEAMAGLFANDDDWAHEILEAGAGVGEGFWRMPLIEEYREQLDHPVADIDNVGKGINAGAITAALFLQEFVSESVKWAHLDIAACGLHTKSYKHYSPGGSGFGVKTLVELAQRLASTANA